MKIIILEDEIHSAEHLMRQLQRYDPTIEVLAVLPSVTKAKQWLRSNPAPDLIFMDIQLEDTLAFSLFEETDVSTPAIFTTAYDDYYVQAFNTNGIDYLLKPVEYDRLAQAVTKYKGLAKHFEGDQKEQIAKLLHHNKGTFRTRFMVSIGSKIQSVNVSDIAYFFVDERIVFIMTTTGAKLPLDYSLEAVESQLDPETFFRVNRQWIVSHQSVRQGHVYSGSKLKLDLAPSTTLDVFVSGDKYSAFKAWFGK